MADNMIQAFDDLARSDAEEIEALKQENNTLQRLLEKLVTAADNAGALINEALVVHIYAEDDKRDPDCGYTATVGILRHLVEEAAMIGIRPTPEVSKPDYRSHINRFFDCSTSCMTKADSELLEAAKAEGGIKHVPVMYRDYGWYVYVHLDNEFWAVQLSVLQEAGFSEAFIAVLTLARQHECWWVSFDADGDIIEGYPTFDW